MKKHIISILVFLAIILSVQGVYAQASSTEAYDNAKMCYADVKSSSKKSADRNEWEKCIDKFEKVNAAFPTTKRGKDALYSAARLRRELYFKIHDLKDVESAIKLYNQLIREYPKNVLADDALYQIAVLRHKPMMEDDKARLALNHIMENYPKGDMVPKAKILLASLGKPTKVEVAVTPVVANDENISVAEQKEVVTAANKSYLETDVAGPLDGAILSAVDIKEQPQSTTVELNFNRPVAYSLEFTEEGVRTGSSPKLDMTLSYTKPADALAKVLRVDSPYLSSIKMKKRIFGSGSRLLFTMKSGTTYEVLPKKSKISVTFKRSDSAPISQPVVAPSSDETVENSSDLKKKSSQ
ncbi:MAG: tetratricopeptide repeat protein [Deltaproteobacteria bacterium]|jgi:tetratricopeptide (TPR) repeat protein|nr:tetratricopeptide repeat protein [Deltaproteobacteria bacterium]